MTSAGVNETLADMIELKKIIVGVDFSEHSSVAVSYAAKFARQFDTAMGLSKAPCPLLTVRSGEHNFVHP